MSLLIQPVIEHISRVKSRDIGIEDFTASVIEKSRHIQQRLSPFITINESPSRPQGDGKLFGLPISVKDNICTKGIATTAGSKILGGYVPPFDATVIGRIKAEGGLIIGKTAMDEFGFGTFSTNCAYGIPKNPFDPERTCGGSSGGAGCLTASADFPHVAIAQSTGGSITAPAAFTGTLGLTPTYGRVSRYGLIDYSNSMDKIGVISRRVDDAALVLSVIAGYDPLDSTSRKAEMDFTDYKRDGLKGLRIGVPTEYFSDVVDKRISKAIHGKLDSMERAGAEYEEISLPMSGYALPAYYLIAMSEASTNLAKFCGLRYGFQEDPNEQYDRYFASIRAKGFGDEAKRRIILGTYARMAGYRDAYYFKALRVRSKVIDEFKRIFDKFDLIATPSMPMLPPRFSDIEKLTPSQIYALDFTTVAFNLAGLPTISVPIGMSGGLPMGMQLAADHFDEKLLLGAAGAIEGLE